MSPRVPSFLSLALSFATVLAAGCGGVSVAPSPTVSCTSRGCDRAAEAGPEALGCDAERTLVRDLGVDRYRATGCGRTVVLDCAHGCGVIEPASEIAPEAEVAYRASFELLCAPGSVVVTPDGDALVASCREVAVRYRCDRGGCARLGPTDEARYALRQLEPELLECLSRSRADVRVSFDARGHVVRVDAEDMRPVRMRGFERDRESAQTKQECVREAFEPLPAYPELAGTDVVFALGGPGARRSAQLSVLAPPTAAPEPLAPEPAPPAPEPPVVAAPEPSDALAPNDDPRHQAAEAALRAAIDARAGAILACTGSASAVLEVRAAEGASLAVALRGALSGSPEEGCVRSATAAVARPDGLADGVIVHFVEAPAP